MKYRKADNNIQHFVEVLDHFGYWKIIKIFYSEEDAQEYIKDNK
jgi:hypothetical protein